jgi:hypothetical protein
VQGRRAAESPPSNQSGTASASNCGPLRAYPDNPHIGPESLPKWQDNGIIRIGSKLTLNPCIPQFWPGFDITYRYRSTTYVLRVEDLHGVERGVKNVLYDGIERDGDTLELQDDGRTHEVRVLMG